MIHSSDCLFHCACHISRKHLMQITGSYTQCIAWLNTTHRCACTMLQKIFNPLCRCTICSTAKYKRFLFQCLLIGDSIQCMLPIILRTYLYKQRTVGIFPVTGMFTHSIDDHTAFHGSGWNDASPRTHAEGIDATAVGCGMC